MQLMQVVFMVVGLLMIPGAFFAFVYGGFGESVVCIAAAMLCSVGYAVCDMCEETRVQTQLLRKLVNLNEAADAETKTPAKTDVSATKLAQSPSRPQPAASNFIHHESQHYRRVRTWELRRDMKFMRTAPFNLAAKIRDEADNKRALHGVDEATALHLAIKEYKEGLAAS